MVNPVAWTAPDASGDPVARTHSPTCSEAAVVDELWVTAAVVGTVMVWLVLVSVSTVTEVPLTAVTSPLTLLRLA
jgi:hypothetical protein